MRVFLDPFNTSTLYYWIDDFDPVLSTVEVREYSDGRQATFHRQIHAHTPVASYSLLSVDALVKSWHDALFFVKITTRMSTSRVMSSRDVPLRFDFDQPFVFNLTKKR